MKRTFLGAVIGLGLFVFAGAAGAVVVGQIDDFQLGTTLGWQNGGQAPPPQNISTGGPAGAGDRYMLVTADGGGAGGRLTVFNFQQWVGNNFVTAGVTAISIDLRNEGSVALSIRLAFQADTFNGAPGYLSAPMLLPVGSGWQHFTISVTSASLIAVGGPAPFSTFFDNGAGWMRIINEVGTSNLNGDPVVGRLGIDNIRAVPEPASVALFASGTLLLFAVARRAHRGR